jgi:hypothetical protein
VLRATITLRDGTVILNTPLIEEGLGSGIGGVSPYTLTDSNGNRVTYNWSITSHTLTSAVDNLGTGPHCLRFESQSCLLHLYEPI